MITSATSQLPSEHPCVICGQGTGCFDIDCIEPCAVCHANRQEEYAEWRKKEIARRAEAMSTTERGEAGEIGNERII